MAVRSVAWRPCVFRTTCRFLTFGPSSVRCRGWLAAVPGYGVGLLCPLLTSATRSTRLSARSVRVHRCFQFAPVPNTWQTSRGKFDRLRRTPAESTVPTLDGYGLRGHRPARPLDSAFIRFFVHRAATVVPRFLQTPPHGGRPCASLGLHLHQVDQRTPTSG